MLQELEVWHRGLKNADSAERPLEHARKFISIWAEAFHQKIRFPDYFKNFSTDRCAAFVHKCVNFIE
jgi:hypothetical protein